MVFRTLNKQRSDEVKIVDLSIRRPVSVFIFSVAAVVFGIVAFRNLAVNLLPDISYPSLTVRTTYEGTAPVMAAIATALVTSIISTAATISPANAPLAGSIASIAADTSIAGSASA